VGQPACRGSADGQGNGPKMVVAIQAGKGMDGKRDRKIVARASHEKPNGVANMPKIKTNRAAAKRFRKTASGKFKAGHAL